MNSSGDVHVFDGYSTDVILSFKLTEVPLAPRGLKSMRYSPVPALYKDRVIHERDSSVSSAALSS